MKEHPLTLTPADESYLQELLAKGSLPAKVFKRATALLELSRGKSFGLVAETLNVCYQSVSKWCAAYQQQGLSMLYDEPRWGRPIEINGKQRAKITALACFQAPQGHSRWPIRPWN